MATPAGLVSQVVQRLERPKAPSVEEIISGGPKLPALTDSSRAGLSVQAQLAQRSTDETEAFAKQREAAAATQTKADDARWQEIQRQRASAVGINRQFRKADA